jgi:three-Cys-motif partner protein
MEKHEGFISIKKHSRGKYRILRKYLRACETFARKYENFAYIETHGGSGKVLDIEKGELDDGSTLIAAKIKPSFPCYIVEIDPGRYKLLEESTKDFTNVTLFHGDCNERINEILEMIPKWEKFIFCFLDPNGLVYRRGKFSCPQLTSRTVDKIVKYPRTEILLNFPLEAILRCGGYVHRRPYDPISHEYERDITTFFGTEKWKEVELDKRKLLELYISTRLEDSYKYWGAILVRSIPKRLPMYYLIYASNHPVGIKIMRNIMLKECPQMPLFKPPNNRFILE